MSQGYDGRLQVLITSPLQPEQVERIQRAFPDRIVVLYEPDLLPVARDPADHMGNAPALDDAQRGRWQALLASADVLFDFDWEAPKELPVRAPHVRWIQASGAGIGERMRQLNFPKDRFLVTTSAGVHGQPLAEFAMMAMLYFAKDVPLLQEWQYQHRWERHCVRDLAGSRVLVLGLGGIGARIAALSTAFGMHVVGMRRTRSDEPVARTTRSIGLDELDQTLQQTDYLVVAMPYTPETDNLVDSRRLALLPSSATLINVGRGKIVDERALVSAVKDGRLRGAALDVFHQEPLPSDSPLWDTPNLLISPHSASVVEGENERIVDLFIENLGLYLEGRTLRNRFDFDRGY